LVIVFDVSIFDALGLHGSEWAGFSHRMGTDVAFFVFTRNF
jgi:hypothetical protein